MGGVGTRDAYAGKSHLGVDARRIGGDTKTSSTDGTEGQGMDGRGWGATQIVGGDIIDTMQSVLTLAMA